MLAELLPFLKMEAEKAKDRDEKLAMVEALVPYAQVSVVWEKNGPSCGSSVTLRI